MHIDKNQGTIYFYDKGKSFANEDTFACAIDFKIVGKHTIFLSVARGKMTKERYIKMGEKFREMGIKTILAYLPTKYKPNGFEPLDKTDLYYLEL